MNNANLHNYPIGNNRRKDANENRKPNEEIRNNIYLSNPKNKN